MTKMGGGATFVESAQARSTDRAAIREEPPEDADSDLPIGASWGTPVKVLKAIPPKRIDDPVRLYLREISSVGLLSRDGEGAVSKRNEAGRRVLEWGQS